MAIYNKDPEAVLDYGFDWSDWLADDETISESTWVVETGLTKDSDSFSDTAATIWLSGGTAGEEYKVTNHVVTTDGRGDDRTMIIRVEER